MEFRVAGLSLLFSILFFIYLFWGVYVFRINPKEGINKVFFIVTISLCIWSCGYAMTNSALDLQTALFWRRLSAVGKIPLFSLLLHFMLLLTNKNVNIKQRKLFMLLHIPAVINIYIFSLSNAMASVQYNMVKINYGWVNKPANNVWDFLYYAYYIIYILFSLIIVFKWKKKIKNKAITRQANLFFVTVVGALVLGSFTDVIATSIFKNPMPQIAPFFILLPVWSMYYSARHYNVLKTKTVKTEEIILSTEQQKKIFVNLAIAICISGVLAFISEYFPNEAYGSSNLKDSIIKGGVLIIIGLGLLLAQRIKKRSLREMFTTIVLLFSIPTVTFQFLDYSTITVWTFPIIIVISAVLFNNRILLFSATIIAIITQRFVWILKPDSFVLVDKYDYILRIIMFIVVLLLGLQINKIYIAKIRENSYRIAFQKIDSDTSFDFVTLNQENFDYNVNKLLMRVGSFFRMDRAYLFIINNHEGTMKCLNEWCNTGIVAVMRTNKKLILEAFPWLREQMGKNELFYIENVDNMPKEAAAEKEQLLKRGVKSVLLLPVIGENEIQGFIGVDSVASIRKWSDEDIKFINIMGNLLARGMMQIKADKKIQFMAYNDHLTKLPNRFLFMDRVNQTIHLSKRTGKLISIIFIDLDSFKTVNDTIGHKGGDILLKEVANGLVGMLRITDTVARFGGDEFMIMLNNIADYKDIIKIADKIMQLFSSTFNVNGQEFLITASAGIAIYPVDGENSDELIRNADIAMYKAKTKGKNQYVLCTKDMKDEVQISMELSNDLYRALERNELIVYYQPQVDLNTNKITGLEALLRWMHPTRGMISPVVFIPIAEKNGLINSIGEWVFRTACMQNKRWQDRGLPHMKMAVNLSAIQFINPKITNVIEGILNETGLDPKYIELEITESIAIKEASHVLDIFNKLKKIGVSIAIDDFGTEYSSLSRLKMLPLDRIKIDMQFVQGIEDNEKDKAITMVIITLAKSLGLNVLAEGVETELQLEFLRQKMCDAVQGYFYYKPMPAERLENILIDLAEAKAKDENSDIPTALEEFIL